MDRVGKQGSMRLSVKFTQISNTDAKILRLSSCADNTCLNSLSCAINRCVHAAHLELQHTRMCVLCCLPSDKENNCMTICAQRVMPILLQVSSGEQSLPQHGAVLTNSSTNASLLGQNDAFDNHVVADESTGGLQQADNLQEGALPGGLSSSDDALGMQDSVTTAVQKLLNSTTDSSDSSQEDHGGDISLEQPIQADRQQTEAIIPDGSESLLSQTVQEHKAAHQEDLDVESSYQDSDDRVSVTQDTSTESSGSTTDQSNPDDSHTVYQTEPQDLASLAQSKPRHSLPQPHLVQVEPHGDDANSDVESDKRFVSQKQMDESGHGGAFAKILDSIPDNVKNQLPDRLKAEPGASPVQDNNSYANETLATGSQTSHIDAGHFAEL